MGLLEIEISWEGPVVCVLGFLGIGIKMLTEEGLIRLNKILHYILRPLF